MELDYKTLVKKRSICKGCITKIKNSFDGFQAETDDVTLIKIKFDKLLTYEKKFFELQEAIEICDEATQDDLNIRDTYDDIFDQLKLHFNELINAYTKPILPQVINGKVDGIKLKPIEIQPFAGDVRDWQSFYDLFCNFVHNRPEFSTIEKFYYLNSLVKGNAHSVIQNLSIKTENYNTALKLLKDRYDNKRIIAHSHALSILQLQSLKRENVSEFSQFIDTINSNLNSLKNLGINHFEFIVIQLICQKLQPAILRKWETTLVNNEFPSLDEFMTFLASERRILESTDHISPSGQIPSSKSNVTFNTARLKDNHKVSAYVAATTSNICLLCKNNHFLYQCPNFLKMDVNQRKKIIYTERLCFNCLSKTHSAKTCTNAHKCKKCMQSHHTLIHVDKELKDNSTDSKHSRNLTSQVNSSYCTFKSQPNKSVLLSTAIVNVKDKHGNYKPARALLDSASMVSFCTKDFVDSLGLRTVNNVMPITGINNVLSESKTCVSLSINSRYENFHFNLQCHILPSISGQLPNNIVDVSDWELPPDMFLADPNFNVPGRVDLLIGAQFYLSLLKPLQLIRNSQQTVIQETRLGFIVSGQIPVNRNSRSVSPTRSFFVSNEKLSNQLESFWKTEEITSRTLTRDESFCERHFTENTYRDEDGRFVVSLPRKESVTLGESYNNAVNRFNLLERRFQKNSELKNDYFAFMNEYSELKHMEPVDKLQPCSEVCYLPHHAVFKESSTTTKTRVVFDGSAKTSNGHSLNSILVVGPTVQQDLFSIVLRFRTHNCVLTGDIPKMYRQIRINPRDYPLQRILWYDSQGNNVSSYSLKTVTYGLTPSSFLATRCLVEIANQNQESHPHACNSIKNDFYMDDLLTGCDDYNQLQELYKEISSLLHQYGFSLHKCHSNTGLFETNTSCVQFDKDEHVKTLGLAWHPQTDCFLYQVHDNCKNIVFTKRAVLSLISSLFDPLGLLAPIIMLYKVFMQELWCSNLSWDESFPQNLKQKWQFLYSQLMLANSFSIPRLIKIKGQLVKLQLHGFADASSTGYGACIYVRSINSDGYVQVHLVCSKSRVAPTRQLSIPRLELNAAVLLSRLVSKVTSILGLNIDITYLWSDSRVVLSWISSLPNRWKTFVANRVSEVQELTQGCTWQHVLSQDNPADVLSRGCTPSILKDFQLWWYGPSFLRDTSGSFEYTQEGDNSFIVPNEALKEEKRQIVSFTAAEVTELTEPFSSLDRALRVYTYCIRFIHNTRNSNNRHISHLCHEEMNSTLNILIQQSQGIHFAAELQGLKEKQVVSAKSKLSSLNPFLDEQSLIRVGGRLNFSNLPSDSKHPIVLSPISHLTRLIVVSEHKRLLHGGLQLVHSALRQRFWIINAKVIIRSVIRKCINCFRYRAQSQPQLLGQLPRERVTISRPFQSTGVDYAGPILVRQGGRSSRSNKQPPVKSYIALFVCLCTKAVHLELVSDLSTECFIAALRRFIGRRGLPSQIFSDNGKNFTGADRSIQELYAFLKSDSVQSKIHSFALSNNVKWCFIPPYAPSWGGLWEAAVKSLKFHLRRVMGHSVLTYEELSTLLIQIESCLNSRPLYSPSSDASDSSPITPGHFLTFAPLLSLPNHDFSTVNINRLSRWQLVQKVLGDFWKRWSIDYLHSLQQRNKCKLSKRNLNTDDLVLLVDDNAPPLMWKFGRVHKVYPGQDGLVRAVDVLLPNKTVTKRSVNKLCLLPFQE